ncbi:MAG TPA: isopeptide-forming domain-containing fimbrial protein, partial [Firmicutes bacterium]|nr:isopeptide-forming domain-containing fimbrial protein [Bacillota bacterium]
AIYWVTGEPKISEPGIDKKVQTGTDEEGNPIWGDVDTAAAGTDVNFKLESTVPENLKDYITYTADEPTIETYAAGTASGTYNLTFHDDMVPALVNPDNYEVKIGDKVLTNDQYTLTSAELGDDCDFHITLDLIKLYNDDVISEENFGVTPITVTYTATLAEGTTAGNYINTAWVSYLDKTSEKDTVTVKTFDITVFKYDQATATGEGDSWTAKGLPGAIFTLYSDEDCTVVVDTATSDNDGYATFTGLDAGTYYLKETAAPEGYVKSDKALEVTITEDVADNTVSVSFANSPIPHTGGMGTTLFSIVGGVLIAMAGTIFVISRRKRRA